MLGAFARMIGARGRLVRIQDNGDQTYAVTSRTPEGEQREEEARDAPPEAFVEPFRDEGGTVYYAPIVEALREWIRKGRDAMVPPVNEKDE